MISSLRWKKLKPMEETLMASMDSNLYEQYKKERSEMMESFKKSVARGEADSITWSGDTVPKYFINQREYGCLIFDQRECRYLKVGEKLPEGYLSMKDGGTVPCALILVLWASGVNILLEDLATLFVKYGYRINGKGVLWSSIDIIPEIKFGIETRIATSVKDIANALIDKKYVFTLVSQRWLQGNESLPDKNQAAVIWGVKDNNFVITSTVGKEVIYKPINSFLEQIKIAWILG